MTNQGGFGPLEFNPGQGISGPRMVDDLARRDGARVEQAQLDDERLQERLAANKKARRRMIIAIVSAVVVIALIVWGAVWLWADEEWAASMALL